MQPRTAAALFDAIRAGELIGEALASGTPLSHDLDWKRLAAVERQFMIVGEALVRVRDTDPDMFAQVTDAPLIIGLRNRLVHGYDSVDPAKLQEIAIESLPTLIAELQALLQR